MYQQTLFLISILISVVVIKKYLFYQKSIIHKLLKNKIFLTIAIIVIKPPGSLRQDSSQGFTKYDTHVLKRINE